MTNSLNVKIEKSIALLKKTEKLALEMDNKGFHLAFSGGKDSIVLYAIAKMAGVKFHAEMQVTTIDPPELMRFIRENYSDVHLNRPKINFYKLIEKKKMLPLRMARYCCAYLKEEAGAGTVTLIGIRKAESRNRAKRNEVEISGRKFSGSLDQFNRVREQDFQCVAGKDKLIISPIINWTDKDIWTFIHENNMPYCKLYDEGHKRIGCIFCPMASKKMKLLYRMKYPKIEREIKKSIQFLIDNNNYMNNHNTENYKVTVDDIFDWWVSNESSKDYFAKLNQTIINFETE